VAYSVLDGDGSELFSGETAVLEDYNIRAVVRFTAPGTYTVRLTAGDGGTLLETISVVVNPADSH
jgi:hypothetical protein